LSLCLTTTTEAAAAAAATTTVTILRWKKNILLVGICSIQSDVSLKKESAVGRVRGLAD